MRRDANVVAHEVDVMRRDANVIAHEVDVVGHDANVIAHEVDVVGHDANVIAHEVDVVGHDANVIAHVVGVMGDESSVAAHGAGVMGDESSVVAHGAGAVVGDESSVVAHGAGVVGDESSVVAHGAGVVGDESSVVAHGARVVAADESSAVAHDTGFMASGSPFIPSDRALRALNLLPVRLPRPGSARSAHPCRADHTPRRGRRNSAVGVVVGRGEREELAVAQPAAHALVVGHGADAVALAEALAEGRVRRPLDREDALARVHPRFAALDELRSRVTAKVPSGRMRSARVAPIGPIARPAQGRTSASAGIASNTMSTAASVSTERVNDEKRRCSPATCTSP